MSLTVQESPKVSALAVMAARLQVDPAKLVRTLTDTCFKGASDTEMLALVVVANAYGLNPFTKEIYAFPDKKRGGIVPVVSVDGWARIINDHAQMDGVEFTFADDAKGKVSSCTCTLWRKDRARPIIVTEFFDECSRSTDPWQSMPRRMLRHKALIQCARVAFGFGGIYDEEEARDISATVTVRTVESTEAPQSFLTSSAPVEVNFGDEANVGVNSHEARESEQTAQPVEAPQATPDDNAPLPQDLLAKFMDKDGVTLGQVWALCVRRKLVRTQIPFSSVEDIPGKVVGQLLQNWEAVAADIHEHAKAA